jgi:ORF6N domain
MKNELTHNLELTYRIRIIRGRRVIIDSDLAALYGVSTKRLNEQVKRNLSRFPEDFMFQLIETEEKILRSQFATSNSGRGGRRFLPYAFTEYGALMAANVLNSQSAIVVSIEIVRAFVQLRQALTVHQDLKKKIEELEAKYDSQFHVVFEAIKQLMVPPDSKQRRIGIRNDDTGD